MYPLTCVRALLFPYLLAEILNPNESVWTSTEIYEQQVGTTSASSHFESFLFNGLTLFPNNPSLETMLTNEHIKCD